MENRAEKRRIVLVPPPLQGHLTPMMQLGEALNMKGFSITIAQGDFNRVSSSSQHFPSFQFVTIPDSLPMSQLERSGPVEFFIKLNRTNKESFKDCIAQLLLQQGNDIACIIYDEYMYFAEAAAKEFKIPNVIFSTTNATAFVCRSVFNKLYENGILAPLKENNGREEEELVPEFHPLRFKDFPTSQFGPLESIMKLYRNSVDKKTASFVIINTASCLETSSLSFLQQQLEIPVYSIGPLHMVASSPTNLIEENKSCIEWLNKQKQNSVIFISLGSLALMEINEVMEMAWGLVTSNQHFLWVIRPGSIRGLEWAESLSEELSRMVSDQGYIVKWAPQKEVLAHHAVSGFWSHCGWNSTLESIGEGVPMICRPFSTDQKVNARYLECVWKIGIQVEGELDRGKVERTVKRLMVGEEGEEMRKRVISLKEKLRASVRSGGSSHNSLDEVVNFIEDSVKQN